MKQDKIISNVVTASSFLPHGKYVNEMGEIAHITDTRMWLTFRGKDAEVMAVAPAESVFDCCPLCKNDIRDGSVVIVTDIHTVFPCWECDRLVEQEHEETEGYE